LVATAIGTSTFIRRNLSLYAAKKNLEIIEVYADQGKSGLKLEGCDALKRVIDDVEFKRAVEVET